MDGWTDGRIVGRVDERTDGGLTDGWIVGWMDELQRVLLRSRVHVAAAEAAADVTMGSAAAEVATAAVAAV